MALKQDDFVAWVEDGVETSSDLMRGFVVIDCKSNICIKPLMGGYFADSIKRYVESFYHHLLKEGPKYNSWGSPHHFKAVKMTAKDQGLAKALGLEFKTAPVSLSQNDPYSANDGSGRTSVYTNNPETTAFEFL